jgi:hypothetical protein
VDKRAIEQIERAGASENTVNGNLESRKDRLLAMWRDLTSEPFWKYKELPPLSLAELTKLDLFEVGDSELARTQWFWSRRRKLSLHKSTALLFTGLCVILSLAIAFVAWPETSMPKRVAEMIISFLALVAAIYLITQRIGFVRWRREYELSIDRLIHTIHSGREGGSTVAW